MFWGMAYSTIVDENKLSIFVDYAVPGCRSPWKVPMPNK